MKINNLFNNLLSPLLIGGTLTLGFAPFDQFYIVFITLAYFINHILSKPHNVKSVFLFSFIFALGFYISSLYWISISLTIELDKYYWLIPFAVLLIPAAMALLFATSSTLAYKLCHNKITYIIYFATFYTYTEILRQYYPLEFPWSYFGYIYAANLYTLTLAKFGVFLLSFATILLSGLLIMSRKSMIIALFSIAFATFYSIYDVNNRPETEFTDQKIRIIQPNILKMHMGNKELQHEQYKNIIKLSLENLTPDIQAIVWPESALPELYYGQREINYMMASLIKSLPNENTIIITGADRYHDNKLYNSILAFDKNGLIDYHDKIHLVPFGEYIPLLDMINSKYKISSGIMGFTHGTPRYLPHYEIVKNFLPLICYEIGFLQNYDIKIHDWALNISNDVWFGNSIGIYQHFNMAKFFAAAYGIPVIRVDNIGVTAVIDPYGNAILQPPVYTKKSLDFNIPSKNLIYINSLIINQIKVISLLTLTCLLLGLIYNSGINDDREENYKF